MSKAPPGMGPTFNQPKTGPVQIIVTGPLEVKCNDPKVKIVKKG